MNLDHLKILAGLKEAGESAETPKYAGKKSNGAVKCSKCDKVIHQEDGYGREHEICPPCRTMTMNMGGAIASEAKIGAENGQWLSAGPGKTSDDEALDDVTSKAGIEVQIEIEKISITHGGSRRDWTIGGRIGISFKAKIPFSLIEEDWMEELNNISQTTDAFMVVNGTASGKFESHSAQDYEDSDWLEGSFDEIELGNWAVDPNHCLTPIGYRTLVFQLKQKFEKIQPHVFAEYLPESATEIGIIDMQPQVPQAPVPQAAPQPEQKTMVLFLSNEQLACYLAAMGLDIKQGEAGHQALVPMDCKDTYSSAFTDMGYGDDDYRFEEEVDFGNGADDVRDQEEMGKYSQWFPSGEDGTPRNQAKLGPSAAGRSGSNPMNFRESEEDMHKSLLEDYEKFKQSKKKINESRRDEYGQREFELEKDAKSELRRRRKEIPDMHHTLYQGEKTGLYRISSREKATPIEEANLPGYIPSGCIDGGRAMKILGLSFDQWKKVSDTISKQPFDGRNGRTYGYSAAEIEKLKRDPELLRMRLEESPITEAQPEGTFFILYVGEKGSGELGQQFSSESKSECIDEYRDSWMNQYDDNNKKIRYVFRVLKQLPGEQLPMKIPEIAEVREAEGPQRGDTDYPRDPPVNPCGACRGKGNHNDGRRCQVCSGTGEMPEDDELDEASRKPRVTARKYEGDDKYSWAVFLDGRPVVTGLGRNEIDYYKRLVQKNLDEKESKKNGDK